MGRPIIWRLSLMLMKPVEGRKIVPMYFPDNMNVQYFFFDTYPGYFLQALPIALVAGIIYAVYKRKKQGVSLQETILSSLFVCYITGLLSLTLFDLVMSDIYYFLFYHMPSGSSYHWFTFEYDFIPDFYFSYISLAPTFFESQSVLMPLLLLSKSNRLRRASVSFWLRT